jgi:hypothetical protein
LAGKHDQSSHGSWAGTTSLGAGSGLATFRMAEFQDEKETQQFELYNAENLALRKVKPVFVETPEPNESSYNRKFGELHSYAEQSKRDRQFRKDWFAWSAERNKYIESEFGNKHLDGSAKGLRGYLDAVINSDWFREEYGIPSEFQSDNGKKRAYLQPEIKLYESKTRAGQYQFRNQDVRPYKKSSISIDRSFAKNEQVILHEIAHYATVISATKKHSGHGEQFAYNSLKIARQFMPEYAVGLEQFYKEGGILYGE